ncbi:MAG TPA: hypothetical protein VEC16_03415 [Alphaproteobacteria bacterium]|nr:hypothetical protein [Alphaproteobacteria bacterium]
MENLERKTGFVNSLHRDPSYPYALDMVRSILLKDPDVKSMNYLFGTTITKNLLNILDSFYTLDFFDGKLREHNPKAPRIISDARDEINKDSSYIEIQSKLSMGRVPDLMQLEQIYGDSSKDIHRIYTIEITEGSVRKEKIPSPTHLNRVAATSQIVAEKEGLGHEEGINTAVVGALHDTIEDRCQKISEYDSFLEREIPEKFRNDVLAITNDYSLIANAAKSYFKKEKLPAIMDELLHFIEKQYNLNPNSRLAEKMLNFANFLRINENKLALSISIFDDLDEALYILYGMDSFKKLNNKRPKRVKFVDSADNGITIDNLGLTERIRNTNKRQYLCNIGKLYVTTPYLKKYKDEHQEDTHCDAEDIVASRFVRSQHQVDNFVSGLNSITALNPVFFENYDKKGFIYNESQLTIPSSVH